MVHGFLFCIASHIVIALPTIARKSDNAIAIVGRAITLESEPSKKKQRTDTKKDGKRIKSDNFIRSKREKSNIAIAKMTIYKG